MDEQKKKLHVLLITRNFPPLTGGMERLMLNAAAGMAEWADLTIIGPKGCSKHCPQGTKVYETPSTLGSFLLQSAVLTLKTCKRNRFDLILGGSGLAAPTLALVQRLFGIKSAIFVHGLDLVVDNFLYQAVFVPSIRRANLVISNSQATKRLALEKRIHMDRIVIINPGTDLPNLAEVATGDEFYRQHNIPFRKIILFVGRMTRRKGLSRFIEQSLPSILECEPEVGLVVVGDDPGQSLTNQGEQEQIRQSVARLQLEKSIVFLGAVKDEDLRACYAMASVQVFPLIDVPGDVEGFGMVAIEAAACGTPTVAFSVGGVADAISTKNGLLIEPADYTSFTSAVVQILRCGQPSALDCISHAEQYDWHHYNESLRNALMPALSP